MRKAFFKKITPGDITLKINNVPTRIKPGQIFEHYFEIVHKIPGIQFVCFSNSNENDNLYFSSQIVQQQASEEKNIENERNANDKIDLKNETINQENNQENNQEKVNQELDANNQNVTSFNNIEQQNITNLNETNNNKQEDNNQNNEIFNDEAKKDTIIENARENNNGNGYSNVEILLSLKKKSYKEIFSMKKKDIKKILDDCSIDYKHIPDTHIDLYKFLLSILQKI